MIKNMIMIKISVIIIALVFILGVAEFISTENSEVNIQNPCRAAPNPELDRLEIILPNKDRIDLHN